MSDLLNSASLVMIPSGYKEDTVYSVVPSDGSGDLSFTRASDGTRVNSAGLVEVVAWNLAEQSETFDNAYWVKTNATITANNTTAPNGTTTADKFAPNGTLTGTYWGLGKEIIVGATSQAHTAIIYAKAGGLTQMLMYLGNQIGIYFNLSNGQFISYYNGVQTITNYSSEAVGDGWYKYTISISGNSGSTYLETYGAKSGAFIGNYTTADNCFIWGAQLNIGSTAKPYFPTTDRLNVPRLTYQNGGGGCPSLLLEKQSTNLVTYSEQFDNSDWTKTNVTITANDTISPDGTQNADLFTTNNAAGTVYRVYSTSTGGTDTTNTISAFFKYGNHPYVFLVGDSAGSGKFGIFNIQNGTIENTSAGYTATITNYGNGWYRCTLTGTMDSVNNIQFGLTGSTSSYAGTSLANGKTMYCWGAMREYNTSYATSYIPTTSSSATRVADVANTNNISSLFGSTEGSFFIEMTHDSTNANGAIPLFLRSSIGPAYNRATYLQFGTTSINLEVYNGGTSQAIISGGSFTNGQKLKCAFAYKQNDFVLYVNGVQIGTDTSGDISASLAFIDFGYGATFQYTGAISEAVLFPTRLTNTQLAQLTA